MPSSPGRARSSARSSTRSLIAAAVAGVVLLGGGCASDPSDATPGEGGGTTVSGDPDASPLALSQGANPFVGHGLYTWPDSKAAVAAAAETDPSRQSLLTQVAEVPTAIWLTPEAYPLGSLGGFVAGVVADARSRGEVPVFVLYGIPSRDCTGGFSSGGLLESDYLAWVGEFRDAVGSQGVAVVEPDAIAAAQQCGLVAERRRILSSVVAMLADGPTTYVDAGHSGWQDPSWMARQLSAIGVHAVRGFVVNVAAYGTDADELSYAQQIAGALGGGSFVIDSGRNGAGSTGEWCNPSGRALGQAPGPIEDGTGADARLWIKPPGESDGTCAGGPAAGTFWPDRAIELATNAGYSPQ